MAGNVELEYPQVTKRTEWNVKESGDNVEFSVAKPSRDAERRLNEFMDHAGLDRSMLTRGPGGSLTLTVPKDQIGQAHNDFSVANLRGYDRANANKLLNITSPK
jgi:hypothetical protein